MKQYLKKSTIPVKANSALRGRLQHYKAQSELKKYQIAAKAKGLEYLKCDALTLALRKRLSKRRKASPKLKGNMHIFLAYYVSNWESILPYSLEPFGRVSAFNWREHGFDDTRPDWVKYRDQMNTAMLEAYKNANRQQQVDAVVGYLSGYNTSPDILLQMADTGTVIFNFCWDDKLSSSGKKLGGRYTGPAGIAHAVDLNLTNSPDSLIKYAVNNSLALFWPEAAHPDVHRPYNTPFEFEVSFSGACYGQRPSLVRKLAGHNIKVECFGHGWPNGPLPSEEMIKLYSRSRINLGFAGIGHSRKLMCLKGRDFEVPMSGGLYLTQNNPDLSLVFDVGNEILTYRNEEDCVRITRELLADLDRAEKVRKAGRKRCLMDHSYHVRWSKVFRMAGLL